MIEKANSCTFQALNPWIKSMPRQMPAPKQVRKYHGNMISFIQLQESTQSDRSIEMRPEFSTAKFKYPRCRSSSENRLSCKLYFTASQSQLREKGSLCSVAFTFVEAYSYHDIFPHSYLRKVCTNLLATRSGLSSIEFIAQGIMGPLYKPFEQSRRRNEG